MTPADWQVPPDLPIPTRYGLDARRELAQRYGLPTVAPRPRQSPFRDCRVLFHDETGEPVCYWEREER